MIISQKKTNYDTKEIDQFCRKNYNTMEIDQFLQNKENKLQYNWTELVDQPSTKLQIYCQRIRKKKRKHCFCTFEFRVDFFDIAADGNKKRVLT